ncbi:winged helix-turn-helix transcriptional regulator [Isobaculum melis]|uniref:DNA-binding transcriptional regulator, HxlR family n=1 Tax=Isobaculum melis TaxID=142588 RepID=A0A1H9QHB2_9LACT|nr:helix-turn-helix domain-containing protein [Isobaculum melis]SER59820.1 DNA-binding transcriptional regulator, HxlR family [Isobaculum melis]
MTNNDCSQNQHLRAIATPLLGKWVPFILLHLAKDASSFAQLERAIEGISRKVLTENLNHLQASGLIIKYGEASTGFPVSYEVTSLGQGYVKVLNEAKNWLIMNQEALLQGRENPNNSR